MKKLLLFSAAMLFAAVTFAQTTDGSAATAPAKIAIKTGNITQPDNSLSADIAADKIEIKAKEHDAAKADKMLLKEYAAVKNDVKENDKTKLKEDLKLLKRDGSMLKADRKELKREINSLRRDYKRNRMMNKKK